MMHAAQGMRARRLSWLDYSSHSCNSTQLPHNFKVEQLCSVQLRSAHTVQLAAPAACTELYIHTSYVYVYVVCTVYIWNTPGARTEKDAARRTTTSAQWG